MKILFIDDNGHDVRSPTPAFRRALSIDEDADVHIALTSKDALQILAHDKEWDELWFDHDLALLPDGTEDTSMIIAQTLAELVFHEDLDPDEFATCVIHTQNPVGRDNLELVLSRWGFKTRHVFW
ncbi:MAG: hypothetical protein LC687_02230 [Actinobacteria bacterium]|nr:hypothetical protein [Actinomycetota bacterium]